MPGEGCRPPDLVTQHLHVDLGSDAELFGFSSSTRTRSTASSNGGAVVALSVWPVSVAGGGGFRAGPSYAGNPCSARNVPCQP